MTTKRKLKAQPIKQISSLLVLGFLVVYSGNLSAKAGDGNIKGGGVKSSHSQQIEGLVTGTVTNKNGETLVGVTVNVQGSTVVSITDANGHYSIQVKGDNQSLRFSFLGHKTATELVNRSVIDVVLLDDTQSLDEAVVTALGIKKEKKALGYSVQDIGSAELMKNKTANPLNSLAGKVAGVNITQSSGSAGAGADIILRGGTSLERDNQPLFVVDGVIYDNSTSIVGNSAFDGLSAVATTSSNRVMDINPEDIENISVLKGPAAAALYGSKAAAGVIIISTKKGKEGAVQVDISSKFTTSWINRLPEQQNLYKRGYYIENGTIRDTDLRSWGAAFGAGNAKYNNIGNFFDAGGAWDNSVGVSGGNKNGSFYLSASSFNQTGVVPTTTYDKVTFRFNGDQKYGRLTVGANVAYSQANTNKTQTSKGLDRTAGNGAMEAVYLWPRDEDLGHYLNSDGTRYRILEGVSSDIAADVENPYWTIYKGKMTDATERITGSVNAEFKIADWWNISYRAGVDSYTTGNYNFIAPGSAVKTEWQKGMMSENDLKYRYLSSNLMTNFSKKFGDFDFNLLLGTSTESTKRVTNRRMGYRFIEEGVYNFNNILPVDKKFDEYISNRRMVSMYGEYRMSYKSLLYLTFTGRNDWSSTLPVQNRSYFYTSVSGSFVFTEVLPKNDILSFGKLRASWAKVGKDADPYVTNSSLWPSAEFVGGITGVGVGNPSGNFFLKPETTVSTELGLEMRFLNGRIGFDYTYYTNNSQDQILQPRVAQSTGYIQKYVNTGDLSNKGMEISITGQPIQTKDFTWSATLNIAGNRGKVANLVEDNKILYVTDVQVGNAQAASFRDGSFMGIAGTKWNRTAKGEIILDANGMPIASADRVEIGNRESKFTGGFSNSFQYKNWNLSFLLDFRRGGDVYNGTDYYMTINGMSKRTENRETLTINGVENTGTVESPVYESRTITFNASDTYNWGGTPTSGHKIIQDYYSNYYAKESANFMTNTNWLRLRSISLSYSLPKSLLDKSKFIKNCIFTITGTNLLLLTNYKGMDPESSAAGSGITGSSSVGIEYCTVPATAGMSFGVNLTF
ncbi:MAG: SusC/RagA family TonB-linked outer membrane protein [Prevotellaceae bacterium]|jgi:TonB-linked SusC/RagA family outer membrane protein|nr:SusC/RagA family TonB-linked outer membrane protein [Prevotellaceae bacterium]